MNSKAEKVYAEAFFSLCLDEGPDTLKDILGELSSLNDIFSENTDFVKLLGTPTVPMEEKLSMVSEINKAGGVSELCGNLLSLLTERNRFGCFGGIVKQFREMFNDHFGIAEITVTSSSPLSEAVRENIRSRMAAVTGKTISIKEKVDAGLLGGVVIDYGSTRYDGSVKSRLNALKSELGGVIA